MNIDVGVRFGVSLDQGKRCYMEDTAACLTDAFSVDSTGKEISNINSSGSSGNHGAKLSPGERPAQLAATARAAGAHAPANTAATEAIAAATATTATATTTASEAAAYFGLFDGTNELTHRMLRRENGSQLLL